MKWWLFLLMVSGAFGFVVVPQAELHFDPVNPVVYEPNVTTRVNPLVRFNVLNNGTRSAEIINHTLNTNVNYTIVKAPSTIPPGYTTSFEYELSGDPCSLKANSFNLVVWYKEYSGSVNKIISDTYSFNVVQGLSLRVLEPERNELVIKNGGEGVIIFSIVNNGVSDSRIGVSVNYSSDDMFVKLESGGLSYFVTDLSETVFVVVPQSELVFKLRVLPTRVVSGSPIIVSVRDVGCDYLINGFNKSVKTIVLDDSLLFTREVVPDIPTASLIVILLVSVIVLSSFLRE